MAKIEDTIDEAPEAAESTNSYTTETGDTSSFNAYVVPGWPKLDYVKTARIVQEWRAGGRDTLEK